MCACNSVSKLLRIHMHLSKIQTKCANAYVKFVKKRNPHTILSQNYYRKMREVPFNGQLCLLHEYECSFSNSNFLHNKIMEILIFQLVNHLFMTYMSTLDQTRVEKNI